jgi:1-acyl-sn-glycerol-3-phosphate acyltransferase
MRTLRAVWRIVACVAHVLRGLLICGLIFPFLRPAARIARVGPWCAAMLRLLGIRVVVRGAWHAAPVMVVANHVSWIDILAINAVESVRFVSKADIRRWPVLGWLVACGGTLFIERERKRDAMRVVHQVAEALQGGDVVAVFPEGTTSDGHGVLPFHANLLQAAITTGTPVQPVALRYADATHAVSPAAAYIGDTSLLQSLWWVVMADGLTAQVTVLPAHYSAHAQRRELSEAVRAGIVGSLVGAVPTDRS